jgi:hypothetical protein
MTAVARWIVMLTCQFDETLGGVRPFSSPEDPNMRNCPCSSSSARSSSLKAIATRGRRGRAGRQLMLRGNDILIRHAEDTSDESQAADSSTISGDVQVRQRFF